MSAEVRERLATLIGMRREYWGEQFNAPPPRSDIDMLLNGPRGGLITRSYKLDNLLFLGYVALLVLLPTWLMIPVLVATGVCVAIWVLIGLVRETTHWSPPRLAAALSKSLCPSCCYDLDGIDTLGTLESHDVPIGPEACPECGTAWPLVPAPTPEEVRGIQ